MADFLNADYLKAPSLGRKTTLAMSEKKEKMFLESPSTRNPYQNNRLTLTAQRGARFNNLAVPV